MYTINNVLYISVIYKNVSTYWNGYNDTINNINSIYIIKYYFK